MSEVTIKANEREAARLYERGVAAARGGQRRVAAGLLSRAVQLNPRHELGWLWLSGMLDDPEEVAFCLRAVLSLNPNNQRAQQGVVWLEQRAKTRQAPAVPEVQPVPEAQPVPALQPDREDLSGWARWRQMLDARRAEWRTARQAQQVAAENQAVHHGESWWVNWRRSRRDMRRARLVFWSAPIVLMLMTLTFNLVLRDAVERNSALVYAAPVPTPVPTVEAVPALPDILQAELADISTAQGLAYLSVLDVTRVELREAIQAYREGTSQPGGAAVVHASAARRLREQIDTTYADLEKLKPPIALAQAHANYLSGLEIEIFALDDMLQFYNSFSVEIANRATLRMEESGRHFLRARTDFEEQRARMLERSVPVHTVR